jgi:hypothetical protein
VATIFGVGSTVVPIMFSLRPSDASGLDEAAASTCDLTESQTATVRNILDLMNVSDTCTNLTLFELDVAIQPEYCASPPAFTDTMAGAIL